MGSGAVMAVPAHDQRDYEFACAFNLPIKQVVFCIRFSSPEILKGSTPEEISKMKCEVLAEVTKDWTEERNESYAKKFGKDRNGLRDKRDIYKEIRIHRADAEIRNRTVLPYNEAFLEEGISYNSDFDGSSSLPPLKLNVLETDEAKTAVIDWLEKTGKGSRKAHCKLRDWLFSRQRYWGEPFPLIWEEGGKHRAVAEEELPVLPPEMEDFKPTGDPRGPLVKAQDWIAYSATAVRETNTMPQWAGSCWYYLRYCDPENTDKIIDPDGRILLDGRK